MLTFIQNIKSVYKKVFSQKDASFNFLTGLNVIVKLIAQQSSRRRRDGSRASTSHWARPVRKLKTMPFNFKIYKEIRKLFSRKELSLIF